MSCGIDVRVGAAIGILTNRNLREDLAVSRLEPFSAQLHQPTENPTIRIIANPRAGPVDADAKIERVPNRMGECSRSEHGPDLGLREPIRPPAGEAD
jgi:hypothetical protein